MMSRKESTEQHGINCLTVLSIEVIIYLPLDMEYSEE